MTTYTETADKLQNQVLDGIRQIQATNLEIAANFSKTAGAILPKTPALPEGYDPKQLIERTFGFTSDILDLQRDYLLRITETLKPLSKSVTADKASKTA